MRKGIEEDEDEDEFKRRRLFILLTVDLMEEATADVAGCTTRPAGTPPVSTPFISMATLHWFSMAHNSCFPFNKEQIE